jgi:steroid 5-alpha reductase family enzyme
MESPSESKQPFTNSWMAWMLVHVIFPLLPFVIEGGLRCLILGCRLDTFSGATLSASMALICFFIYQSLITILVKHDYASPLPNDQENNQEEKQRVGWAATLFLVFAIVSTALFSAIVSLSAVVEMYKVAQTSLSVLQVATFFLCSIPVLAASQTQKSFKLCATF